MDTPTFHSGQSEYLWVSIFSVTMSNGSKEWGFAIQTYTKCSIVTLDSKTSRLKQIKVDKQKSSLICNMKLIDTKDFNVKEVIYLKYIKSTAT